MLINHLTDSDIILSLDKTTTNISECYQNVKYFNQWIVFICKDLNKYSDINQAHVQ